MVQNHGGLQPLRDFFHIPATAFTENHMYPDARRASAVADALRVNAVVVD
jgi:hypothetical protein